MIVSIDSEKAFDTVQHFFFFYSYVHTMFGSFLPLSTTLFHDKNCSTNQEKELPKIESSHFLISKLNTKLH
jgi:hypothetical protein